jgi:hypothetical protein
MLELRYARDDRAQVFSEIVERRLDEKIKTLSFEGKDAYVMCKFGWKSPHATSSHIEDFLKKFF